MTSPPDAPHKTGHVSKDSPFYALIQDAYRVFQRATPGGDSACECCIDPNVKRDFFKHGPRDMPLYYLTEWYSAAVPPVLPLHLWAYLLPRIFDALASHADLRAAGVEVLLSRFPTGDPDQWTAPEWDIIDRFQRLYLAEFQPDNSHRLDDIICMFVNAGWKTKDLFTQLQAWPTERLIALFWQEWCTPAGYPRKIWISAFWPKDQNPIRFYTSETLQTRMLDFGVNPRNDPALTTKAFQLADIMMAHQIHK